MLYIIILSILLAALNGAGFNYPATLPPPKIAHYAILFPLAGPISGYETPIALRYASIMDAVAWNCVAVYHETAKDALTKQRPAVVANNFTINNYGNSPTRLLCLAYAQSIISINYYSDIPDFSNTVSGLLSSFGLDPSFIIIDSDVADCDVNDADCLQDVAEINNYYPEIMASIIAYQALDYLKNDGWNQDGSISKDGGICTANCRRYSDTTNYEPNLQANNRWVPLMEDNGKGFFYKYDHVTPHIGTRAVTKTITRQDLENNAAPKPKYKYKTEKQLVIDRLADLATNDTQKMLVEFFDNKIAVAAAILFSLDGLLEWSLEERIQWMVGYTATEYDAVVQAWREKVIYDLIRPTTLIKNDGKEKITTYGGPYKGLQEINSEHFESYQRVMPHSEYPSASGCICHSTTQYTDKWLKDRYGIDDSLSVQIPAPGGQIIAGSSKIEPGTTPANSLLITFNDLTEYRNICGESRLWGGMHFTTSVPASYILCANLGEAGYEYTNNLL